MNIIQPEEFPTEVVSIEDETATRQRPVNKFFRENMNVYVELKDGTFFIGLLHNIRQIPMVTPMPENFDASKNSIRDSFFVGISEVEIDSADVVSIREV
jgi:hypothetical protein